MKWRGKSFLALRDGRLKNTKSGHGMKPGEPESLENNPDISLKPGEPGSSGIGLKLLGPWLLPPQAAK